MLKKRNEITMKKLFLVLFGLFCFSRPCFAQEEIIGPVVTPLAERDANAIGLITFEELSKFSVDWEDYVKWMKKKGKKGGAAHTQMTPSPDYSKESQKFLERRDWTVDRFFYVEGRIRETLSYLIKVEKRDEYIKHVESQVRAIRASSALSDSEKDRMETQLRNTVSRKEEYIPPDKPLTDGEIELVKANRATLVELMSQ